MSKQKSKQTKKNTTKKKKENSSGNKFSIFTRFLTKILGHPFCFVTALAAVFIWALTGSYFNYNDTWQLVINTATTIATFLMVFLLQNTQNRDTLSIQLKLDEIIKSMKTAHNDMIDIEEMSEEELEDIHKQICAKLKK